MRYLHRMVDPTFRCECGSQQHKLVERHAWTSCGTVALALLRRGSQEHMENRVGEPVRVKCDVCGAEAVRFIDRRAADPHEP